ncbi:MAG TPA: hypothetical protein VD903_03695, partial [Pseudonocardia sp.]|nr:hypothetical protein [Pseudonocardia sp.]
MVDRSVAGRRLLLTGSLAGTLVAGALVTTGAGAREGDLVSDYDRSVRSAVRLEARPHQHRQPADPLQRADGHGHDHGDPSAKNALSRGGETGAEVRDPTPAAVKVAHTAAVAAGREARTPRLTTASLRGPRSRHPEDRYAMAGGCYRLTPRGEPLFFQATDLGRYLLYDAQRRFVAADGTKAARPGDEAVWTARMRDGRTTFRNGRATLEQRGTSSFLLRRTTGCARYPEARVNVRGAPFAGTSPFQEVRGYVDAH